MSTSAALLRGERQQLAQLALDRRELEGLDFAAVEICGNAIGMVYTASLTRVSSMQNRERALVRELLALGDDGARAAVDAV